VRHGATYRAAKCPSAVALIVAAGLLIIGNEHFRKRL
jgi:hypothetical protein